MWASKEKWNAAFEVVQSKFEVIDLLNDHSSKGKGVLVTHLLLLEVLNVLMPSDHHRHCKWQTSWFIKHDCKLLLSGRCDCWWTTKFGAQSLPPIQVLNGSYILVFGLPLVNGLLCFNYTDSYGLWHLHASLVFFHTCLWRVLIMPCI